MKAKRKSIFRLDEICCEEAESPNYLEAIILKKRLNFY